ncbi:MAG: aldehyde ferredoxin oxidoreductase family protein [Desulfobacula sp.]|uniref:aldehyde ferredoxin oxidoreductase family protein n=1 Tax=Desulfobacula sp. TaxID=2593537 RepID=UPI0025C0E5BD|nr:aldehyde ferredoxin oxidoreductase family protein [Desulfobacula sp.]MCD4721397.1 aldehyde ferredoxin oxidoreductase family protein [Desulfobacula sp.]
MLLGYTGKIAWVDLTQGSIDIQELSEGIAKKYIGGKGLGAHLLYKHLKPGTDPLGPDNIMIFVTGPLTGTNFPAVSRSGLITKSPQTGTFLDSYSGGFFGTQLKWAGFDAIAIKGKAREPSYLLVEEGEIQIKKAEHLWGLTTSETEKQLREKVSSKKGERMSIAAIGPAGENLVKFANIINEKRAHGRGGAGAVMGSKNLKAVIVRGNLKPHIDDEAGFKKIIQRCRRQIAEHPMTKKGGAFPKYGTTMTIDLTQETGTLPSQNWQENTFEEKEKISGDALLNYVTRPRACFACPIGCSRDSKASVNDKEYMTEGPDYETMYALGPNCGICDPAVIIAADHLCDDYGMDTISCGVTIGFAMECFEKGLISKTETDGMDLSFTNGTVLLELIHKIAKCEGVGALLAQGSKRMSKKVAGSKDFAIHIKGLELPGYDPRGMKGQGLSYALSDRGGCHVRGNTLRTELMGLPEPIDRYGYEGKADMVRKLQLSYATCDCIIACLFGSFAITPKDYVQAISAVTGWTITEGDLQTVAERAWNLTRLFNAREGFTRQDDTLPERLFTQGSTKGPSKGEVMDRASFDKMLDEYYDLVGWDKATGIPGEEKLKELEIEK